jgi:hypothetical protein
MEKSKTANRYSAEVRSRAVRMVLEHGADHASQWAAISVSSSLAISTSRWPIGSEGISQANRQARAAWSYNSLSVSGSFSIGCKR